MLFLLLSIAALAFGWAIWATTRRHQVLASALDGFVLAAVGGICLLHLIPESTHDAGPIALAVAAGGFAVVWWTESHGAEKLLGVFRGYLVPLVILGLAAHAFLDGSALASAEHFKHAGLPLALAVILHRLPIGAVLGRLSSDGIKVPAIALAALIAATVAGFFTGTAVLQSTPPTAALLLQAFVAGGLLHVVLHEAPGGAVRPGPGAIGAALGAFATWFTLSTHPHAMAHSPLSIGQTFLHLSLETAPALLIAFMGAGLMKEFIKPAAFSWLGRGNTPLQAFKGMAFGFPLPICSCGVLPFYATLARQRVPAAAAVAFLIATPEIGIDAMLLSWPLLGSSMTVIRLVAAALVAWLAAVVVSRIMATPDGATSPTDAEETAQANTGLIRRIFGAARFGLVNLLDDLLPWLLIGLVVASFLEPSLRESSLTTVPAWAQVPFAAILGLPIYVCASGSTPMVAVLLHKGLSPGAAIAFLLTGPATNLTTFGAMSSLHGRRSAFSFALVMIALACTAGWVIDGTFGSAASSGVLEQAHAHTGPWSWIQASCLTVLAIGGAFSLWRKGPRGWLHRLQPHGIGGHDHHHDHGHGHSHDDHGDGAHGSSGSCCH